jgi:hypothetical protein
MFCPVCGKELDRNERFCSECGSEIIGGAPTPYVKTKSIITPTPEPTKTPTYTPHPNSNRHTRHRRRGLKALLFIFMLIVAGGGVFGIVMWVNWGTIEGHNYYYSDNPSPASVETINFNIEVSDVLLQYNESQTDHLVEIDYHYLISGGFMEDKTFEDIYTVTWDNNTLTLNSDFKWFTNWVFNDRSVITITLRSDVVWAFNGAVDTGSLDFIIPENTILDNFTLGATTGDIDLTILNGTVFQKDVDLGVTTGSVTISGNDVEFQQDFSMIATTGDLNLYGSSIAFKGDIYAEISTGDMNINLVVPEIGENMDLYATTGDIDIEFTNVIYNSDVSNWVADVSTGSVTMVLVQPNPMATNVTANFHATTGDIDIEITIDSSIGARFSSSITTGDINYSNNAGFEDLGSVFQTVGYPDASNYEFTLAVTTGGIDVSGTRA